MATARITKRFVDRLTGEARIAGRTLYVWDDHLSGFGVLATQRGSASYFVEYRLGGRGAPKRRVCIGKHGALTPDQARKLAREQLGEVAKGHDIAQLRREAKRRFASGTFKEVCERYLAMNGKRNASWNETRRLLEHDAIPMLGGRPLAAVTRGDVAAVIDTVTQRKHSVGRALFAAFRPMFRWALDRGIIDANPIADLKGPAPLPARKRTLSCEEVKAFWLVTAYIDWPFGPLYRLLLLTGQRREEVAGMRWEEIDLERGLWRLPPEEEYQPRRTKNGQEHIVDLSPPALTILCQLAGDRSGLVFSTTGTTPVSGFSKAKARLDVLMTEQLGRSSRSWRIHDLRRTVATMMGEELDVDPGVIERILNHMTGTRSGLQGIYQRQQYREKRKRALLAWGQYVEELAPKLAIVPSPDLVLQGPG